MPKKRSTMGHTEAREYWDSHGIDEESPGDEEVEVRTSKNLSTILSIRMDREHIDRLKLLAKEQGVGVTTMARMLLNQALDQPTEQSPLEAIKGWMAEMPTRDNTGFLVLPASRMEHFGSMVGEATQRLWMEALRKQAFTVGHEHAHALFELRELAAEDEPRPRA